MQTIRILTICAFTLGPFFIYWYVIRPRLQVRFVDTYANLDAFWDRAKARYLAFQTLILGAIGLVLPELVTFLEPYLFTDPTFIPETWKGWFRGVIILLMVWSRARMTTPRDEPPSEEF